MFLDIAHAGTQFDNESWNLRINSRGDLAVELRVDPPKQGFSIPMRPILMDLEIMLFERVHDSSSTRTLG